MNSTEDLGRSSRLWKVQFMLRADLRVGSLSGGDIAFRLGGDGGGVALAPCRP